MKQPTSSSLYFERSTRFWYGLLAFLCLAVYFNTVFNEYGLDDYLVTNHNQLIEKGLSALPEIFTTNYIAEEGLYLDYRPLIKTTFVLEYVVFGWNPHISHFINVLLFALACCLVLKVLLQIFGNNYFRILFLGVVLYALHPLHTEVVASLKNRDELLVLIFTFLSAHFFIRYQNENAAKFFVLGALMFFLAMLSKISAVPFIASIPLMLYFISRKLKTPLIVFGTLALMALAYYTTLINTLPGFTRPYDYVEAPLSYVNDVSIKLGTALYSLLYYLKLLVAPLQFSFYYGFNYVELQPVYSLWSILSLLLHLAIFGGALYFFKRKPFVSFFLFFYLVQISFYSNIVFPMVGIVGERAAFFASLSFTVLIAWLIDLILNRKPIEEVSSKPKSSIGLHVSKTQLGLVAAIALFYSVETVMRNSQWKDTITLFQADMPHLQNSAKANYMMAKELRRLYRTDKELTKETLPLRAAEAVKYYEQAIKVHPDYAEAMEELGMIYAVELKNNSMAIPLFEKAWSIDSTLWRSASNLANCYFISKDNDKAIYWYEQSLNANPKNARALEELAKLYYVKGEKQKALEMNDRIMKMMPESFVPYYNYAVFYMMEKDTANAVKYFEQDIAKGDKEQFPYKFLFNYYLDHQDTANAVRVRNLARQVSP